jgi:diguanylate cyclase (GGDEF)-like protein/PAS domain S-box-containing protein
MVVKTMDTDKHAMQGAGDKAYRELHPFSSAGVFMIKMENRDGIPHEKLLENLFDGVYFIGLDRKITFWNKAAERITGYTKAEVIGSSCQDNILRHIDENGKELCIAGCPLHETLMDGKVREVHVYLHHKQGHRVPVSVRVSPVRDESGTIIGGAEIFSDNSNLVQIIEELEKLKHEAYIDALTSVGNRRYGDMILNTRIYEWNAHEVPFGVIFLDLDDLKRYNDAYGHRTGDEILVMVGKTLSNILRRMDTVSRWGGEEFAVILPHIDSETLERVADRIRTFIESSFLTAGGELINITASIGVTMALTGDTPESIMHRAETLMYVSKTRGRNRITIG